MQIYFYSSKVFNCDSYFRRHQLALAHMQIGIFSYIRNN